MTQKDLADRQAPPAVRGPSTAGRQGQSGGERARFRERVRATPTYDRQQALLSPGTSPIHPSNQTRQASGGKKDGAKGRQQAATPKFAPGSFGEAVANNIKDREAVEAVIQSAEKEKDTQDVDKILIRNAAQWIRSRKSKLFALTPTHDSRTRAADKDPTMASGNDMAVFPDPYRAPGATDVFDASPTTYKEDYATFCKEKDEEGNDVDKRVVDEKVRDSNVMYFKSAAGGFNHGDKIVIFNARQTVNLSKPLASYVSTTLKHEVQHAADGHGASDLERYKTEFRAYWLDGRYNLLDATTPLSADVGGMTESWASERQYAIFKSLYDSNALYGYVAKAWDADKKGEGFRKDVLAFKEPEGLNLLDSPRIAGLEGALTQVAAMQQAPVEKGVEELLEALVQLDESDWAFIDGKAGLALRDRILAAQKRLLELAAFASGATSSPEATICSVGGLPVFQTIARIQELLASQNLSDGRFSPLDFRAMTNRSKAPETPSSGRKVPRRK